MDLSCVVIRVSLVLSVLSFTFYASDLPPILLSAEKMNEVLLAIFSAGVSSLFIGLLEYSYKLKQYEERLLIRAERMISSFGGMRECAIESVRGVDNTSGTINLIQSYLDESSYTMHLVSSANPHEFRDKLISAIECSDNINFDAVENNADSDFSKYVSRLKRNLLDVKAGYRFCFDSECDPKPNFIEAISDLSYLPLRMPSCKSPICLTNRRKKELLLEMKTLVERAYSDLEGIAQICRLFEKGEANYSDLLDQFLQGEKTWIELRSNTSDHSRNRFESRLWSLVKEFSEYTTSSVADKYANGPW